jgi:hypothetical protein
MLFSPATVFSQLRPERATTNPSNGSGGVYMVLQHTREAFIVLCILLSYSPAFAQSALPSNLQVASVYRSLVASIADQSLSRVRSPHPEILDLITVGAIRSATFRTLVAAIDATNGIVYIEQGPCGHGVRACLIAVSSAADQRVLRIRVRSTRLDDRLIATIGHELRHALEILADPTLISTQAMLHFYLRQGSRSRGGAIETDAAVRTGQGVIAELASNRKQEAKLNIPRGTEDRSNSRFHAIPRISGRERTCHTGFAVRKRSHTASFS